MYVRSKLLSVRHGFSTRHGGVSEGPYASLNLGRSVGDDPDRVDENGRRLAREFGLSAGQLVAANQVHGDVVLEAERAEPGERLPPALGDADAVITRTPGVAVGVRTADCVPLLLHAPDVGAVAAVHAGWRGALMAIPRRAVERMSERYGANPRQMVAAIGPSIRSCCYEVDAPLAARFVERFGEGVAAGRAEGKSMLDLVEACRRALLEAGLERSSIDALPHCTCCDAERFFSHRRDRGQTGRQLAVIEVGSW